RASRNDSLLANLNTLARGRSPRLPRPEEPNPVLGFFHCDMTVLDPGQQICQFREFVIMRCKNCLATDPGLNVLDNGPRDRQPVECGGAAADLIENDQASGCCRIQNDGRFR